MRQVDADPAEPGPGELIVRVCAAALALPDVLLCRGTYPLTPPLPFTPGLEFVGVVSAAGPGVMTPVGARVMGVSGFVVGLGSFAAFCKTWEPMVFPAPPSLPDAAAAAFTIAYHTAYSALVRRARLMAGETVLVHGGAGGTGFAAIQLAKALGARVIATATGRDKATFCQTLGADRAIDGGAEDFVPIVNAETGGRGADIVFDPVGGDLFERSVGCLSPEGRLLPIGFACGRWGVVSPQTLAMKNISIVGALGGGFDRDFMLDMHDRLVGLHQSGAIGVAIDRIIGFDDIAAGLQDVSDRKAMGRIVAAW
jgi:NADPH2:quinone reductase